MSIFPFLDGMFGSQEKLQSSRPENLAEPDEEDEFPLTFDRASLEKVLKDPVETKLLLKYAEKRLAAENILFFRRTSSYISMMEALQRYNVSGQDDDQMNAIIQAELQDIYHTFICPDGMYELNLTNLTRKTIEQEFQKIIVDNHIFDKARAEVFDMIFFHLFRDFIQNRTSKVTFDRITPRSSSLGKMRNSSNPPATKENNRVNVTSSTTTDTISRLVRRISKKKK